MSQATRGFQTCSLVVSIFALALAGGCGSEAPDDSSAATAPVDHAAAEQHPAPPPPPTIPGTIDITQACNVVWPAYEGFFCEDASCDKGATDTDHFNEFEYAMYGAKCLAGGTPPDAGHPNGERDFISYFNPGPKAIDFWLYSVCPIDSVDAMKAVNYDAKVDPIDSRVAGYCFADGTESSSPTKTVVRYDRAGRPYNVTLNATGFIEVHDPRCYTCVTGPIEPPPPGN